MLEDRINYIILIVDVLATFVHKERERERTCWTVF